MTRDLALGSVLLAIAGTYYLMTAAIPDSLLADAVGPQGLPKVYAILLALLALVLMARAVRGRRAVGATTRRERTDQPARTIGRVTAMLAIGVVYIAVVPFAGYVMSIAGVIVGTASYQGGGVTRPVLLVGAAGALLLWLLFVMLLRIPQPAGIWPAFS
jgi:putative tricarboxylic transport membrane protein